MAAMGALYRQRLKLRAAMDWPLRAVRQVVAIGCSIRIPLAELLAGDT
jgi:hypothetical protein